ncbi:MULTISPECIES: UDP-N-acetylmuramoyl-tripeptide--D-alanyl-D-alanine ligase [unclassified Sporosarcina]|uniref:UDP-N-acetylmuramoyl-tripeptide--D-alanyl-D- alanine ligase n=1 Tax=unclassified Sporosarcina TaxID=2647733 RepID=UPI000C16BA52|nr:MULTISPECIES: UDP-N-acetylmuramoyl-tripeptide--D-alanyl-D-alanine ligase [unclassified Sporosarcina]PID06192.1 UDP-N-acetylmuramoylalanyl-D-glutamate--2,6-diaminopimelate ligase [Sporosarcina sp. P30]PID09386.1 UDP-N-acetylmuramoylalanyl-D-glutamate--2,6-diaminopimelate ligase [Sporosarcina sp. P31]PID12685.1 UDP-N-acetylmuramoylalanyl-D-glutamate--2,6-diaminopimelate ligase [Sporosarcina sp. P32b]
MKRNLSMIQKWLQAEGQHIAEQLVTGVSIDSRNVQAGDLFIPFRGEQVNGHQYVNGAIEQGAVAALWLKDEPNPPADIPLLFVEDSELALQQMARSYRSELTCTIIGVTGSNGKTSTKDLIAGVLSPYRKVKKTEGNFNNELGLPLTLLAVEDDTEVAILEMGMSGYGEISFLSTLAKPQFAVITNIGEAHMQDLGSREGIAKAKFEIIDGLVSGGVLLYDGDEPLLNELVHQQPSLRNVSFGYEQADLTVQQIISTDKGSSFTVNGKLEGQFTIPVYGSHQVKNALAAIMIAKELDLTEQQIEESLSETTLTDMRMQPIAGKNGSLLINDAYNAAPTSMRAAFRFIDETAVKQNKWLVLGDMLELGTDEQRYHEELADELKKMNVNGIALFGPRMKWLSEQLKDYPGDIMWTANDTELLADALRPKLSDQTVVLFKGSRGMKLERIIKLLVEEKL